MTRYASENILPYNEEEQKSTQVRRMFDSIAHTYDLLNHTLSLGIDRWWRKKGIAYLKKSQPESILDLASGTGDLAITMCKKLHPAFVIGADISEGMMKVGRRKAEKAGVSQMLTFEYQDALSLTYPDNTFDAVTAAFGVRNYEDIRQGLSEMFRVLKPGGRLMILELSTPETFPMKQLYRIYSRVVIPAVGRLFSREKSAYEYLPASISVMPQGKEMTDILTTIGFNNARAKSFTFGICSMYTGEK